MIDVVIRVVAFLVGLAFVGCEMGGAYEFLMENTTATGTISWSAASC